MVIVIGASGFIGTYLVDRLTELGIDVLATGRSSMAESYYRSKGVRFQRLDITKREDIERLPTENVEGVVLLAAMLPANVREDNPFAYVDANINATLYLLEYCRKNKIKKIISTTSYADLQLKWTADFPIEAESDRRYKLNDDHASYIITKNAATDFILHYNQVYGLQGCVFRLPPVYGVGPHGTIYMDGKKYKSGLQIFIENAMEGKPIEIYGNKDVRRDVVYVKDVVEACVLALKAERAAGIYNITSGVAQTLEEHVKSIIEVFSPKNHPSSIIYSPDKPNNSRSFLFDVSKATKDFGYKPRYVPFAKLLSDYKQELVNNRFLHLTQERKKVDNE